jgi:WASH complex subunit 7
MLIEKLQGVNPWMGEMQDLMRMVQFEKVRMFDGTVDLKFEISESFNASFYNLNILNMHDQETYEIMRVMGNHLFDLKLHDVFLPNYTIERDKFDILTVVRNIPTFVGSYKYNMLNQRFLELTGENKIINCISIQQLSDSIRTHGLGILSTTVNAFYKFMIT